MRTRSIRAFSVSFILTLLILMVLVFVASSFKIAEQSVTIEVGEEFHHTTATWLVFDVTDKVKIEGELDTSKVGAYKVIYKFGILQVRQQVNVVDNDAPIITLQGEKELYVTYIEYLKDPGYEAFDEYDGDLTKKVVRQIIPDKSELNKYHIIYMVKDSSGNTATAERIAYAKPAGEIN